MNSKLYFALTLLFALLATVTSALPASEHCHELKDKHAQDVCKQYCEKYGNGDNSYTLGECGKYKAVCTCETYTKKSKASSN